MTAIILAIAALLLITVAAAVPTIVGYQRGLKAGYRDGRLDGLAEGYRDAIRDGWRELDTLGGADAAFDTLPVRDERRRP